MKSLIQFNPGPLILEYGSYMGEASLALAQAVNDVQSTWGTLNTKVLAMDSFEAVTGYEGMFMQPATWVPPASAAAATAATPSYPMPYYQFVANSRLTDVAKSLIVPFPMLASNSLARAHALGAANPSTRPKLIYVNPVGASLRRDLPVLWRLLACGGTMAGAGYHLADVQPEVDTFAESKAGATLEAFVVHAPGSTKYERLETTFSHEALLANRRSNVSFWRFRSKPCGGAAAAGTGAAA